MRSQRQRLGDGEARPVPHFTIEVETISLAEEEGTSPHSALGSRQSSRTSLGPKTISQFPDQPTCFLDDEDCEEADETVDTPVPCLWTLTWQHRRWLALPVALLVGALVGAYFLMTHDSVAGAMALYGVVYAVVLTQFVAFHAFDSHSVVLRFRDGMELLLQCNADQVHSVLSHDPRVRYLQALVFNRRSALTAEDARAAAAGPDPLEFVRMDLKNLAASSDGAVVLDSTGTILWCNAALQGYFGYTEAELVSENIRILIPSPYNTAHDSLMRKYDRDSSIKKIVGCIRLVPVIDKAEKVTVVDLSVEERIDPAEGTNNLFLGCMKFPEGPDLHAAVQDDVAHGADVVDACNRLKTRKDSFLLMDAKGSILFANPGITRMLGWTQDELVGANVSLLMNPEVAAVHDAYLARFTAKAREHLQATGKWPQSGIVGQGRDLYARCRRGGYVRIWLTVHRIDAPSHTPEDCWFMGSFIYIQGQDTSAIRKFTSTGQMEVVVSPRRRRPSNNLSARRISNIFSKAGSNPSTAQVKQTLSAFAKRKCTVVLFDLHGLQSGEDLLRDEYHLFLSMLTSACTKHNAQVHNPIGDRIMVTLNLAATNASQRSSAGLVMQQVLDVYHGSVRQSPMQVYAAGTVAEAFCATLGRQPVMVSESLELASLMLGVAADARLRHGLIDPSLHDELQYAYECRLVNTVTLHPNQKRARTVPLFEMFSAKVLDENEWMYQIKPKDKEDPLAPWRECWDHLQGRSPKILPGQLDLADVEPAYDAALRCLMRHTFAFPDDRTATWLRQAVLQRQAGRDHRVVERAGKLRYTTFLRTAET